jgi:hypothetical protein
MPVITLDPAPEPFAAKTGHQLGACRKRFPLLEAYLGAIEIFYARLRSDSQWPRFTVLLDCKCFSVTSGDGDVPAPVHFGRAIAEEGQEVASLEQLAGSFVEGNRASSPETAVNLVQCRDVISTHFVKISNSTRTSSFTLIDPPPRLIGVMPNSL